MHRTQSRISPVHLGMDTSMISLALMRRWRARLALCLVLFAGLFACDDAAPGSADTADEGAHTILQDAEPPPDEGLAPDEGRPVTDATVEPRPDRGVSAPEPAYVEVRLDPARALYTVADQVRVHAVVSDRTGRVLDRPVTYEVAPPGVATVDAQGLLTLTGEGPAAVLACATPQVCGRAALFIDAGPPTLVLSQPLRGAALGADGSRVIAVRGTATDTRGPVDVRVNGVRVAVGDGGIFAVDLPARFGLNRVEVVVDDGVQPPLRESREVIWAPRYTRPDADGVTIPGALVLQVDQRLLDSGAAVAVPVEAGVLELGSLAEVVSLLLALADPISVLGDPQIVDSDALSLRIEGVDLGRPEVAVYFTAEGIELFLRIPDLAVSTTGAFQLEGNRIPLTGRLRAGLAAFARLGVRPDAEHGLSLTVDDVAVAVESLSGEYPDATARALVSTLGTALSDVARDLAGTLVTDLVAAQLPDLVGAALDDVLATLREVPLDLNTGIAGVPVLSLRLGLTPSTLDLRRHDALVLGLDARVSHTVRPEAPHTDPGIPTLSAEGAPPALLGGGLTALARLELVNAILHAAWRAQLLQIEPPLPAEVANLVRQVSLDGRLPPVLAPSPPGSVFPLQVQLADLRVALVSAVGGDVPDRYSVSLTVGVAVQADGTGLALVLDDDPDVRASLLAAGGARAFLNGDQLAGLLEGLVWPQVQRTLAGGLRFGLDGFNIDVGALGDLAPRIVNLTAAPRFDTVPWVLDGRLVLEGGLAVEAELGPGGP